MGPQCASPAKRGSMAWTVIRVQPGGTDMEAMRKYLSADNVIQENIKMAQDLRCASSAFPGDTKTKQDSSTV